MKKPTAFKRYVLVAAASMLAMLTTSMAQADPVICAVPKVGTHQYQTTGASDCVWGSGNIGEGGAPQGIPNDDFLAGLGENDDAYGDLGPTFGLTGWTMIESQATYSLLTGLTVSNYDSNSFTWVLTASGYDNYALGLKDGADPKWAVFLLSSSRTGDAAIVNGNGGWSHFVLYGTMDGSPPRNEIPEPGTLALVGFALLGGAALRRRRA